jgi:hypothetical protein
MKPSTKELDEVNVSALSRMMTMKKDTLLFSSAALRLPPNASLATLMNQLPGIGIDKDGNMTYQGKVVNQILVDGKPFFGDVNTALANMPTDAVQNVKIYDKTDEEKEYRGELDTDKATVVDLTIKKEYKSKWMANVDLGGGTDKRCGQGICHELHRPSPYRRVCTDEQHLPEPAGGCQRQLVLLERWQIRIVRLSQGRHDNAMGQWQGQQGGWQPARQCQHRRVSQQHVLQHAKQ